MRGVGDAVAVAGSRIGTVEGVVRLPHSRHTIFAVVFLFLVVLGFFPLGEYRRLPSDQMGQGRGVLDSFGACPMVRHALAMTCVQSLAGSGIANSNDAVCPAFLTPVNMLVLTC